MPPSSCRRSPCLSAAPRLRLWASFAQRGGGGVVGRRLRPRVVPGFCRLPCPARFASPRRPPRLAAPALPPLARCPPSAGAGVAAVAAAVVPLRVRCVRSSVGCGSRRAAPPCGAPAVPGWRADPPARPPAPVAPAPRSARLRALRAPPGRAGGAAAVGLRPSLGGLLPPRPPSAAWGSSQTRERWQFKSQKSGPSASQRRVLKNALSGSANATSSCFALAQYNTRGYVSAQRSARRVNGAPQSPRGAPRHLT